MTRRIVILITVLTGSLLAAAEYYADPTTGKDSNSGSIDKPWQTIKRNVPKLKPGDTLYLRDGVYYEYDIDIENAGTAENPITITAYRSEKPILDGSYPRSSRVPNEEWKPITTGWLKGIWVSTYPLPDARHVDGYLEEKGQLYRLVRYPGLGISYLSAKTTERGLQGEPYYIGPGLASYDKRIFIRLDQLRDFKVPAVTDPNKVQLHLFPETSIIRFLKGSAFWHIQGIAFRYHMNFVEFQGGSHHVTINNCSMKASRKAIEIFNDAHHLVFDNIRFEDFLPKWVQWADVKQPPHFTARGLQGCAIWMYSSTYSHTRTPHHIDIGNCEFKNSFDGIDIADRGHDLRIHNNRFIGIKDDAIQMGTGWYNVEIDHNFMGYSANGISKHGSGDTPKLATKYIHHNVIDCSHYDETKGTYRNIFGHHNAGHGEYNDPWKIYNNTLVFSAEGRLAITRSGKSREHEVYNNIYLKRGDGVLFSSALTPGETYDGNLYFREAEKIEAPLLFIRGRGFGKYKTLKDFRKSAAFTKSQEYYKPGWEQAGVEGDPKLDKEYRPGPQGPAAHGAIDLSKKGWPGADGAPYRGAVPPAKQ